MNIDDFIHQFVVGYLFGDLDSMAKITVPAGQKYGGVGYPMVATTLAGMELLGVLLTPDPTTFNPHNGNKYFLRYWNDYFAQQNPAYVGLGGVFRQLMRNGVTHIFVAKHGIFVEKGSGKPISINPAAQEIHFDCNVFYKEFRDSYDAHVQPILDGTPTPTISKASMQKRLDELVARYSADSASLFAGLIGNLNPHIISTTRRETVPTIPQFTLSPTQASGASAMPGPTGPLGAITTSTSSSSSPTTNATTIPPTASGSI